MASHCAFPHAAVLQFVLRLKSSNVVNQFLITVIIILKLILYIVHSLSTSSVYIHNQQNNPFRLSAYLITGCLFLCSENFIQSYTALLENMQNCQNMQKYLPTLLLHKIGAYNVVHSMTLEILFFFNF